MFDIGWTEMALIAAVAIIVIGPKDLPMALKTVGQWMAKARAMAREFQGSVDEMIRESEIDKLKKDVEEAASKLDVTKEIQATTAEIEKSLEMPSIEMDPLKDPPKVEENPVEPPVQSVAAPPPDAPRMPLPSDFIDKPLPGEPSIDQPPMAPAEPAQEAPEKPVAETPSRAAGSQG
jgi:sec-independent protein translocase protein TatB